MNSTTTTKKTRRLFIRGLVAGWAQVFLMSALSLPAAERQVLHGHVPAVVAQLASTGRVPPTEHLDLAIGLPLRNRVALTNLLQQIYDPASTNFHHYLTPEQFAEQFGPVESDYRALMNFVTTNGLAVTGTYSNRALLDVSGSVADIQKIFHVALHTYRHPHEQRMFHAPDTEPAIDLAVPLLAVAGLDNYVVPQPGARPQSLIGHANTQTQPGAGSGAAGDYMGNDFRAAYLPGITLNGSGQAVGLLELDGYYASDIATYEATNGLPGVTLQNVPLNFSGAPSANTNSVAEVSLDIEVAIAMAPGLSKVIVYEATNSGPTFLSILTRMASDNAAKQLSSSWFLFDNPMADQSYLQFAMQGQSFFQCSGDFGAFYPGISQWADNPNITVVGGTGLTTTGPGGAYVSETAWNNNDGTNGTGGGVSGPPFGNYPIPGWQSGINMSANKGSTSMRNVPDVSMVAQNVRVYYFNGLAGPFWGTSIAAPLWAGFTALVNQQAQADGKPSLGFINPALYTIGKGPGYAADFNDINTGNNTNKASFILYSAVAGYDLCTGWGTPTTNLISALEAYAGPVFVAFGSAFPGSGTYTSPYANMTLGINKVLAGGTIMIETAGSTSETINTNKPLTIQAIGGPVTFGQ